MGRHATSFNVITDSLAAWLTLLVEYLRVVRRVAVGRHAWKPLPEVDSGATDQFAAVLHGWNADPKTERFPAFWPTDADLAAFEDTQVFEPVRPEVRA